MYSHAHRLPLNPLSGVLCTASDSYARILYPHHHAACELSLILDGVHVVELENDAIELSAGGLILLRPNEIHSRRAITPGLYLTVAFPGRELERLETYLDDASFRTVRNAIRPPCGRLNKAETEDLARRIERVNLFVRANPARVRVALCALLTECWCRYWINPDGENQAFVPWLNRLLPEMNRPDNIRRGLGAMLELVPYSHAYLCRAFRQQMGCTPTAYVNRLRLDRAHTLLETTRMNIADICYEVGFDSASYFYQLFREKYGIPPARYRKMRFVFQPGAPAEQRGEAGT